MRRYLIGFFELAFWFGTLAAAARLWTVEREYSTAGMLVVVCLAFTLFTIFGHRSTWTLRRGMPLPEEALRRAASGRTVRVGDIDLLPGDTIDAVLLTMDEEAPPTWLSLGQNVLVSLGLVGTFLGLTIGIYSAAGGILSPDPEQVKAAMGALMGGAKLAFAKSLAGVVAAMIWSFRHGALEDLWTARRATARAWLERTFPPLSSERLLAMTLAHMESTAAQQAAGQIALKQEVEGAGAALREILVRLDALGPALAGQLSGVEAALRAPGAEDVVATLGAVRNTVSQLADALPDRMGAPIAGGISAALAASLNPKLDEVAKGILALSEARGGLEKRVGEQVSGQVTELGVALSALQGAVDTLKDHLVALPSQVEADVRNGTDTATQALSRDLLDAGQKVAERLSGAAADLSTGSDKISASVGDLRAALGESAKVADVLRGAGDATAASLIGVQAPLDAAAAQVVAANLALTASATGVVEAAAALKATAAVISDAEPKLREAWHAEREAAERLLVSTREAQEPLAKLVPEVEALRAGCGDLLAALKAAGADHTATTAGAGERLAEALNSFQTGLAAITQTLDSQSGKLFQDAAARATEAAETVGKALQGGAEGFEASMDRMVARSESLEALFEQLDELTARMAEQQSTLIDGLAAAAAPLERAAESLTAAAPALDVARKGLESEREGLAGLSDTLKGSAAAVQSIFVDTQRVRASLDVDIPTRLAGIERARRELEQAWEKAGAERDAAWTASAGRLTQHVRQLQQANIDITKAWSAAEQARTAGLEQNAREIAQYAERVNQAIRLPQKLTDLNAAITELVDVLNDIKQSAGGPA